MNPPRPWIRSSSARCSRSSDLVANGMTMIMATHQIGFSSAFADEIIFMEDGVVIERGTPAKILSNAECERTREFCSKIAELYGEKSMLLVLATFYVIITNTRNT